MRSRRYPIGVEITRDGNAHARVWAPKRSRVELVLEAPAAKPRVVPLQAEPDGYFSAIIPDASPGSLYRYRLDGGREEYPDPASRFQPDGPHGPSQIIDPSTFAWTDGGWTGVPRSGQVVYEMHIGTFTSEGTWDAARRGLPELAAMGITLLEVMPVADFPGAFGWGYDGVNLFAPTRLYGRPDDFRRFVDAAHGLGLGVILDVVYNHIGPDGNYLLQYADAYFSERHKTEWGDALNFDGDNAGPVREYFCANAAYWIDEYHLDGLRLDATQQIFDASPTHILADVGRHARAAAPKRAIYLVAENETQEARLARPVEAGGYGLDAIWNDDFHHSAVVALSGRNDAYYSDHRGSPQEFISAAKWGFLFQGQRYAWQNARRGRPSLDLAPDQFVTFIENHDQIANSGRGLRTRVTTSPGRYRAMTALLLLGPATPMLFQGQEFGATTPFFFFADHHAELADLVCTGRRKFLEQFANLVQFDLLGHVPEPHDPGTFARCKLNWQERDAYPEIKALHQDLLRLRREDPVFGVPRARGIDGAVLGPEAFVLRYFGAERGDRLLVVNFGRAGTLREIPEPLLAPPESRVWVQRWSSEEWRYGGTGHVPVDGDDFWTMPGEAAVVLAS